MIKFQVDLKDSDERVILMGKKIIVPKPKTFFQKYGTYFAIGLAMVVQVEGFGSLLQIVDNHPYESERLRNVVNIFVACLFACLFPSNFVFALDEFSTASPGHNFV